MKKILIAIAVQALALAACQRDESTSGIAEKAVIEAYLAAGAPVEVRIAKMILYGSDGAADSLPDLPVRLLHDGQSFALAPQGGGRYALDPAVLLPVAGATYGLEVEFQGETLTATTSIPAQPMGMKLSATTFDVPDFSGGIGSGPPDFPDPVKINWGAETGAYYLVVVENIETDPAPLFDDIDPDELPSFRSEPVQTNHYELNFQNFKYYGRHRVVLCRILPEYATLYQTNGDNSLNLSNVPTNIVGTRGLGIFTGIAADTLFLDVE